MQAKNDQFDEQAAEECCVEIVDHAENIMRDAVEHFKKLCPKGILINPTICFRTSLIILFKLDFQNCSRFGSSYGNRNFTTSQVAGCLEIF